MDSSRGSSPFTDQQTPTDTEPPTPQEGSLPPFHGPWVDFMLSKDSNLHDSGNYESWRHAVRTFMKASGWQEDQPVTKMADLQLLARILGVVAAQHVVCVQGESGIKVLMSFDKAFRGGSPVHWAGNLQTQLQSLYYKDPSTSNAHGPGPLIHINTFNRLISNLREAGVETTPQEEIAMFLRSVGLSGWARGQPRRGQATTSPSLEVIQDSFLRWRCNIIISGT